jgi:quinol monooxygenase YgiN
MCSEFKRTGIARQLVTINKKKITMYKFAMFARLEAKPGKEDEVEQFLETALGMAKREPTTLLWFALRLGPSTFAVFDTFADEKGRQIHLNGPIAQALMAKGPELFTKVPVIESFEVLGSKQPG